jgi:hypothetical protein
VFVRLVLSLGLPNPLDVIQHVQDDWAVSLCLKLIVLAGLCEVIVPHAFHVATLLWGGFIAAFNAVFDFLEHARDRWRSLTDQSLGDATPKRDRNQTRHPELDGAEIKARWPAAGRRSKRKESTS